ncbi:MAG: membrane protein insertion efficiency factor YidD [Cyclobacteriaceae bacterium]
MKTFSLSFMLLVTSWLHGQDASDDFELLLKEPTLQEIEKPEVMFKGLLKVYQNYFSDQIINDCIYEHSCSTFSQGAINDYGLIKGGFLSIDRLIRCNRASGLDFVPSYFNEKGEIKDHWSAYRRH